VIVKYDDGMLTISNESPEPIGPLGIGLDGAFEVKKAQDGAGTQPGGDDE
jgi:hypothetical protein